ncbi:HAMP domain-containing histidine kinase [Amycolatopsis rubida]|uniref:histidine kinase n=1 Tax=Amycolatopsis rubida TaxID=112413 RepID=A0A1I5J3U7_9PSEU|nr:HAMP domain-containing sensor histidine kinase [Amycolatopsis rubida]MYW93303.1 two-component sensor histidine kinase [Amycolatopsis rubida]NEC58290.1 HAMP domain-containing histidine kinase [Amycolatopsis rubida]SFO67498.1 Signal transduction histidine kinase [Amycolatopsis rubida]
MTGSPSSWWSRRSLQVRITVLAAAITLGCLLGLAALAANKLDPLLTDSVDKELSAALVPAAGAVSAGTSLTSADPVLVRVLDIAGNPADGQARPKLTGHEISQLKAGVPVQSDGSRWRGQVVSTPNGSQRLVVAGAGLVGFAAAVHYGGLWLVVVALVGALVAGLATWLVVRLALRPVARMRGLVRALPPGSRLPLPTSHDEMRALAEEFNALLERQEEVSQRLRRFTGDAAHELRSPVASIRVQAEVAVTNPDPELSQETLSDILEESERLSGLLDGLLALARSDAGEVPPAEPVEVVSEVRAAVRRLPSGAPDTRVSSGVAQAWASAAHQEVELVLDNLLRNACRYASGQIVVSVLASRSKVRVVVDDDGPGIAPEHRSKVFDRFYRVSDDRARSSGGTGLGLAMVAETVRRRGGQVRVGESPDGGARFEVTWRAGADR